MGAIQATGHQGCRFTTNINSSPLTSAAAQRFRRIVKREGTQSCEVSAYYIPALLRIGEAYLPPKRKVIPTTAVSG